MDTVRCPSNADEVESAFDTVLWRNDIEEPNKDKKVGNIVWED